MLYSIRYLNAVLYPVVLLGAFCVVPAVKRARKISRNAANAFKRNVLKLIVKIYIFSVETYFQTGQRFVGKLVFKVFYIVIFFFLGNSSVLYDYIHNTSSFHCDKAASLSVRDKFALI